MDFNFSSFFTPQHTKRVTPSPQYLNCQQASQHCYSHPYKSASNIYTNPYSSPGGQYAYNPYNNVQQNQLYDPPQVYHTKLF